MSRVSWSVCVYQSVVSDATAPLDEPFQSQIVQCLVDVVQCYCMCMFTIYCDVISVIEIKYIL